jgi:hypothetical protein
MGQGFGQIQQAAHLHWEPRRESTYKDIFSPAGYLHYLLQQTFIGLLQDLSQPPLAAQVAFTFSIEDIFPDA